MNENPALITTTPASLQAIDCIFCGADAASDVVVRENGFVGRQCGSCGLIFISPRPSLGDIVNLYGHDEAHVPAMSHLSANYSKRLYARHSLRLLRKHKVSGDLLEVGAGAGYFLDEARKLGFNPFAIEFNGTQAHHIRGALGIPCVEASLSSKPFPVQSFDVVYHCDVISHFYDPVAEFKASHEALRDDGLLVFETGNFGDVDRRHLRAIRCFQYPDHLFFFSTRNISQLLASTGFELLAIHRYSIGPELWTQRVRTRVRKFIRRFSGDTTPAPGGPATTRVRPDARAGVSLGRRIASMLKAVDQFAGYLVRYRLGALLPANGRPQSMIVVARKIPVA